MRRVTFFILLLSGTLGQAQSNSVGSSVYGDFNGDGIKEYAFCVQTEKGYGNTVGYGIPGTYAIFFSTGTIPEIRIECCEVHLVNEGDLNGDGTDDLSLYQAPMNGNTFSMHTVSLKDSVWDIIIPIFLIPTAGTVLTPEDLGNRVFLEDGILYYLDADLNDENFRLLRRKVDL